MCGNVVNCHEATRTPDGQFVRKQSQRPPGVAFRPPRMILYLAPTPTAASAPTSAVHAQPEDLSPAAPEEPAGAEAEDESRTPQFGPPCDWFLNLEAEMCISEYDSERERWGSAHDHNPSGGW